MVQRLIIRSERWIVVRTQPNRENWAKENVIRQHHECYLPLFRQLTKQGGFRPSPLFPGYIFVRSSNGRWHFLEGTYGVSGVIMEAGRPGTIEARVIDDLCAREDSEGLVVLPTAPHLVRGQQVKISGGPFIGYSGIYDESSHTDRVRVLLDYLGRKTPVLIAAEYVKP